MARTTASKHPRWNPPDQLVLVALRADDDLDYGKLARELGANPPHRASVRSDRISKRAWSSPA
jgi:hypothetical protein